MNRALWKNGQDLSTITREMNEIAKRFWGRNEEEEMEEMAWSPRVNVSESKDNYTLELDLPGIKKEDVKINLKEGRIHIEGERKSATEKEDKNWIRKEVLHGKFCRNFSLPDDVDADKIEAKFSDGVLVISLTKREETKPKEISIAVK